jgi:hypothetical protein
VATVLARAVAGKAADDFVFVSPTGLPIHHADFYERVWTRLMGAIKAKSVAPFRIHDLRHTHVSWLIACGERRRLVRPPNRGLGPARHCGFGRGDVVQVGGDARMEGDLPRARPRPTQDVRVSVGDGCARRATAMTAATSTLTYSGAC